MLTTTNSHSAVCLALTRAIGKALTVEEIYAAALDALCHGVRVERSSILLFDPETVIDRATFAQPFELPAGIKIVFINGAKVWSEDRPTGSKPGKVLTH